MLLGMLLLAFLKKYYETKTSKITLPFPAG
jgi:hypothetical protein